MKFLIFAVVILIILTLYACIVVGARADEQSQQLFQKWKNENLKKNENSSIINI